LRAGIAALAIALVLAPVAFTKTKGKPVAVTAHAGDKATLTLSAATSRALKKAHVTLQAVKPSTHKKSTFTLPTKSGRWNFTAATGTLNLKGALRVKQGKRAQKLGTLVFSLDSVPGLSVTPLGSASGGLPAPLGTTPLPIIDGSSVTLPLPTGDAGLSFANGTVTGTIPLSGGIQLDNGQISATITNPTLTLGTGTEGSTLSASVNGGPEVKLFDIDTTKLLQAATPDGGLSLSGLLAELSSEGAATLNQVLGTNAFTTGQPIGGLTIILPQAPSS